MKQSIFKFPTLRNMVLTDEKVSELGELLKPYTKYSFGKIIYFAKGKHITHESKNGGIFSMGQAKEHNAISFEVQTSVYDEVKGKKRPLYLLVWVGGYTKGAVYHCGWQYPHYNNFSELDCHNQAKSIFAELVKIFYNNSIVDKDILNFIK